MQYVAVNYDRNFDKFTPINYPIYLSIMKETWRILQIKLQLSVAWQTSYLVTFDMLYRLCICNIFSSMCCTHCGYVLVGVVGSVGFHLKFFVLVSLSIVVFDT